MYGIITNSTHWKNGIYFNYQLKFYFFGLMIYIPFYFANAFNFIIVFS